MCHFAPSLQRAGSQPRDCQCWGHPPGTCKGAGGALRLCAREHRGHASSCWSHKAGSRLHNPTAAGQTPGSRPLALTAKLPLQENALLLHF